MPVTKQPKPVSQAAAVFARELSAFAVEARLSRREGDIINALVQGVTRSEEIAQALGISTHTVNNHLKSIFDKTRTGSKTDVLAAFLQRVAARALEQTTATEAALADATPA